MTPSTDWKEIIAPDEAALFERLANDLGGMQMNIAKTHGGPQRGLHAKGNLSARAEFEVLAGIPAHARVGLFAEPKRYDALVRFSNGAPVAEADRKPGVRGIAVKVMGVGGKKVIPGMEACLTQDFLGILTASQPFRTPEDFVWFVLNISKPFSFLPKAILRMGPSRFFTLLMRLKKSAQAPLTALHSNRYFSALPIRFGQYAAKYSFVPLETQEAQASANPDLGAELEAQLSTRPLRWELQVQFYTDEQATPLEDSTVDWTGPWTPVARLTLPQQSLNSEKGQQLKAWAESLSFDPWHAQEELRPVGAMMRARNAAYRVSTQLRKAAPEPTEFPAHLR